MLPFLVSTADIKTLIEKYKMDVCRWTHNSCYEDQDRQQRRDAEYNLLYWQRKLEQREKDAMCTPF